MRNFLAAVLSVIAVGVMLIAYGLLSPRASAADLYPSARPMLASERLGGIEDLTPRQAAAYPVDAVRAVPVAYDTYRTPVRLSPVRTTRRAAPVRVERPSGRDWTKTAMVIGGTTAAGAGLGAIFGGKKGALIGAALGGGAGTLFEVQKR
jgi:hypothetical protein